MPKQRTKKEWDEMGYILVTKECSFCGVKEVVPIRKADIDRGLYVSPYTIHGTCYPYRNWTKIQT